MARPARRWPNVERGLVAWLSASTGRPVFTETPDNLEDHLPAYRIERVGGTDAYELGKEVQVEVNSLAATRPQVWGAVADVETAVRAAEADRLRALVLWASLAKGSRSPDYPFALTAEQYDLWLARLVGAWGGAAELATFAPSLVNDRRVGAWWASLLRAASSPGACSNNRA